MLTARVFESGGFSEKTLPAKTLSGKRRGWMAILEYTRSPPVLSQGQRQRHGLNDPIGSDDYFARQLPHRRMGMKRGGNRV